MSAPGLRGKLGCWWHERLPAEVVMAAPALARHAGRSWLDLRNRHERLRVDPLSGGRECLFPDSSKLTLSRVFPAAGERLLRHALRQWPIALDRDAKTPPKGTPAVSIIFPVGGRGRLGQFQLALAAARGQQGVDFEIVVVEQSPQAILAGEVPADVRYVHDAVPEDTRGFNKSRAFNVGARAARGEVLVLLDADYLVPAQFARECLRVLKEAEAARPARFIFYLDEASTAAAMSASSLAGPLSLEAVVANNPTPLAVRASVYRDIGGHDESYLGWGNEDTEFVDRLRTRRVAEGGWMPVVHAWHAAAPGKTGERNREHHRLKMLSSAGERIEILRREYETAAP